MRRKSKAYELWKQMKPAALRRLALAVFLVFSVLGPLMILMESKLEPVRWNFVLVQTIGCGGMAASIILFGRKRWWITFLIVCFWSAVLVFNGGGLSLQFDEHESFRVRLNGPGNVKPLTVISQPVTLSPEELDALYVQRGSIGILAIALLASGYISFVRVMRSEVKERARFETEINIAKDIQQSLLPNSPVSTSWYSAAGTAIAATEVAGDFFDIIELSEDRFAVAIADVAGHGIGAGILSAMTKSALRSQLRHDASPVSVLKNLNATVYEISEEKMFVTFAYVLVDRTTRSMSLATAGHPPILFKQADTTTLEQLRTIGLGLGIQSQSRYIALQRTFQAGDSLLLFTDGIVEAMNTKDEQFGNERLHNMFAASHGSPVEVCSRITSELEAFIGSKVFQDDVSLVCVKFT